MEILATVRPQYAQLTAKPQVRSLVRMGWLIGRVLFAVPPHDGTVGDHPSPDAVADTLQRPTRELGRTALEHSLYGLAPSGVCLATAVSRRAGGLLHRRFTLTAAPKSDGGLFSVALIPRVAPGGRYPPPCPVEPGPSSTPPVSRSMTRSPGQPIRVAMIGGERRHPPLRNS